MPLKRIKREREKNNIGNRKKGQIAYLDVKITHTIPESQSTLPEAVAQYHRLGSRILIQ